MVQRYREHHMVGTEPADDGDFVEYEDFAALKAENDAMKIEFQRTVDAQDKDHTVVGQLAILNGSVMRWRHFLETNEWL